LFLYPFYKFLSPTVILSDQYDSRSLTFFSILLPPIACEFLLIVLHWKFHTIPLTLWYLLSSSASVGFVFPDNRYIPIH
jgi:hypothetical protein